MYIYIGKAVCITLNECAVCIYCSEVQYRIIIIRCQVYHNNNNAHQNIIFGPFYRRRSSTIFPRLHIWTHTHTHTRAPTHPHTYTHARAPGNNNIIYYYYSIYCAATVASRLGYTLIVLYYTYIYMRITSLYVLCVDAICLCECVYGHRAWDHPSEPFKADRTHVV